MKALVSNQISWAIFVGACVVYLVQIASVDRRAIPLVVVIVVTVVTLLSVNELSPKRLRRNRMEQGRCPSCAYDLRHDFRAGCPECGWKRA